MRRRGFTLVEMLTVIAVSSILLAIILIPLVQSFNFTRTAQAFVEAQERARQLIARIQTDISNAAAVRDNEGDRGRVAVVVPGQDGTNETVLLDGAKLDLILPSQGDPSQQRDGAFVDPDTGRADPTLQAPKGQVVAPVTPGMTIRRFFIGLKEPLTTAGDNPAFYANPNEAVLGPRSTGNENLYVLYVIDFQPFVFDGTDLEVNTALLTDTDLDNQPDDLDDPYFFVLDPPGQPVLPAPERAAKAARIANWKRQARIITSLARYDMILPIYNRQTGVVSYDGNKPRLMGLVQFRPESVGSAPAAPQAVLRQGEEAEGGAAMQADVYRTDRGGWSSAIVRIYPGTYDSSDNANNHYLLARFDSRGGDRSYRVYRYDPDSDDDGDDRNGEGPNPNDDFEVFDIRTFDSAVNTGLSYPFTRAMDAADGRSGWLGDVAARESFVPFYVDRTAGKVHFSFGIDQVGDTTLPPGPTNNLPYLDAGPALTPVTDTGLVGNFYDPAYATINKLFNKLWWDMQSATLPDLRPNVHRFVDLRVTPNEDGTESPLDPDANLGFARAFIVPGSEVVYGPDQNPGPNYGNEIRYTRTTREPGVNQYKLNYVNLPEPDYAAMGLPNPPAVYDSTDFVSAIVQPRYKAGYLQLNSDPNVPLPDATIRVYYRFQLVGPTDTVTVDYDTREAISITLSLRSFPRTTTSTPQILSLQGSATVRNFVK